MCVSVYPPTAVALVSLPTLPPTTLQPVQGSANCDFESGICAWRQATDDQFDWTMQTGQTPSLGTGPTGDHSKADGCK